MKMMNWFTFAIISLVLWGFWGFFYKIATNYIDAKSIFIWSTISGLIITIIVIAPFFFTGFRPEVHAKGITFAMLGGIMGTLGALLFLFSMKLGKASVVVTITALYPIITIILAFFILKETITLKQGIGILFALTAVGLLAK